MVRCLSGFAGIVARDCSKPVAIEFLKMGGPNAGAGGERILLIMQLVGIAEEAPREALQVRPRAILGSLDTRGSKATCGWLPQLWFLFGSLTTRSLTVLGTQKGSIVLTTDHVCHVCHRTMCVITHPRTHPTGGVF